MEGSSWGVQPAYKKVFPTYFEQRGDLEDQTPMNAFYYLAFYAEMGCEKVEVKVKMKTKFRIKLVPEKDRNYNRKLEPEEEKEIVKGLKNRIIKENKVVTEKANLRVKEYAENFETVNSGRISS